MKLESKVKVVSKEIKKYDEPRRPLSAPFGSGGPVLRVNADALWKFRLTNNIARAILLFGS
jgi:hypothetical protein